MAVKHRSKSDLFGYIEYFGMRGKLSEIIGTWTQVSMSIGMSADLVQYFEVFVNDDQMR